MFYDGENFYLKIKGDDIISYSKNEDKEYGRFNFKTGISRQWYSRIILDKIYMYLEKKPNASICVLGGAVAAIPYELLTHFSSVRVTTVDIDDENIEVLKNIILVGFGNRSKPISQDAKKFVKETECKYLRFRGCCCRYFLRTSNTFSISACNNS